MLPDQNSRKEKGRDKMSMERQKEKIEQILMIQEKMHRDLL